MSHLHFTIRSILAGRARLVLLGLALATGAMIAYARPAQALGALPYLLLLACPLMHVFMMRGHASHSDGRERASAHSRLPTPEA